MARPEERLKPCWRRRGWVDIPRGDPRIDANLGRVNGRRNGMWGVAVIIAIPIALALE